MGTSKRILLLCYGNPARQDDGLGPAFARRIEEMAIPGVTVESNYQLMLEDAVLISQHDLVIFVDATVDGQEPYTLIPVPGEDYVSFTTHEVRPGFLIKIGQELFASSATGYALGIRGYRFDDFGEELSAGARANLEAALLFLKEGLNQGAFDRLPASPKLAAQCLC